MRHLGAIIVIAAASLLLAQPCNANKELSRSLEEMQSASGIVLDGTVTKVVAVQKPTSSNEQGDILISDDYQATFKVETTIKGQIRDESIILAYSRINNPRFKGDNPPLLQAGDRFRLFADKVESFGPPQVIRVRSVNAVRPEAIETNAAKSYPTSEPLPPAIDEHVSAPNDSPLVQSQTSEKEPEAKLTSTQSDEPTSSTPWSVVTVLIVAAFGLLWLLLKGRK